jgi:hypothetical protein
MPVISSADYLNYAKDVARGRILQTLSPDYLYDAVEVIVLSQDVDVEIDLLMSTWNLYQQTLINVNVPSYFVSGVATLQHHVMSKAVDIAGDPYADINDWLRYEGIQVPEAFADISTLAGWTIDHDRTAADPTVTVS